MRISTVIFCLPIFFMGCSEKQPEATPDSSSSSARKGIVSISNITFVQSPETVERDQISAEALVLLENQDYVALDALAEKYRLSKERYSDGIWKLGQIYSGLEPPDGASDADWQARINQIKDWVKARPESITPRVMLARLISSYAWKARGSGYADTVNNAAWNAFFARLRQSQKILQDSRSLTETCPLYWSTMQRVALGLQTDRKQYDAIFAEAIKEYPEYDYYYTSRAIYLLPRWYGEPGEWLSDLTESCDRIGGEAGDALYARVMWMVSQVGAPTEVSAVIRGNQSRWQRIDKGFNTILEAHPNSSAAISGRAFLAGMAGARDRAQSCLHELNGRVDLKHWNSENDFRKCLEWAFKQ